MTDPKILSGMKLLFPVRDRCRKPVAGQGKEQRISITYMGKGIECDVEAPTQDKGRNLPEDFSIKNDPEKNEKCTPDDKGMDGPGNDRIPDNVPERVVHPFQKASIGKHSRDKHNHIYQVGEKAPHTHFPGPGFSIKEGIVPEKVFVRAHGVCPFILNAGIGKKLCHQPLDRYERIDLMAVHYHGHIGQEHGLFGVKFFIGYDPSPIFKRHFRGIDRGDPKPPSSLLGLRKRWMGKMDLRFPIDISLFHEGDSGCTLQARYGHGVFKKLDIPLLCQIRLGVERIVIRRNREPDDTV
ncbi:MAG: hypothetical protein V3W43_16335 [Desulfatiglandaceae bacterium]|jgi:hypothetical protein